MTMPRWCSGGSSGRRHAHVRARSGVAALMLLGALVVLGGPETPRAIAGQPKPPAKGATGGADEAAAIAAAFQITGLTVGVCTPDDPPGTGRLGFGAFGGPAPSPAWRASVARGIALFGLQYCMDAGAWMVLGRTPSGAWAFWKGGNNTIVQRYSLPGDMIVCADVAALPLRAAPQDDAPIVATLPFGSVVTGESFVLTEPGSYPYQWGAGWYRLVAPHVGWAPAPVLLDARQPDCTLRGAIDGDEGMIAFMTALRLYGAVPGPCAPDDGADGPPRITRLFQLSDIPEARWRASAERGIATFLLEICGRTSGRIVLGRPVRGGWGLLRGGPVGPAPAFLLPGEMVVCAPAGAPLRERPSEDAALVAILPDGAQVTGDSFVLTEPGVVGENPYGAGWYHLAAPWNGWAYSEALFDPGEGGCPRP